jgi:hypothetical protein
MGNVTGTDAHRVLSGPPLGRALCLGPVMSSTRQQSRCGGPMPWDLDASAERVGPRWTPCAGRGSSAVSLIPSPVNRAAKLESVVGAVARGISAGSGESLQPHPIVCEPCHRPGLLRHPETKHQRYLQYSGRTRPAKLTSTRSPLA